jgi:hypothetical protein
MSKAVWPFDDPPNVATLTVQQIVRGGQPILLVVRAPEDGGWQFLTGEPFEVADGMVVSLKSMIDRDPTLTELADLRVGWQASREKVGYAWQRTPVDEA